MFRLGISLGRNDLNLEGHLQMGYNSKTVKNYGRIEEETVVKENLPSNTTEYERVADGPETVETQH